MTKINPILNIKLEPAAQKALSNIKNKTITPPYEIGAAAVGSAGVIVSTLLQDYKKTEQDNYFQFKINPETGKPFEPDIFQQASGMNLYMGNDVLVTAPTGTGKTAIAEYIMTKNLKDGKRTFYTTPLKALSNEKFKDFCKTYGEENVGLLTGDSKINENAPIIIMTTEVYRNMAASGRFNFTLENSKGIPTGVKTVIFDELQYLGDVDRGGIWEQSIMFTPKDIQILSLSATIGNNEEINNWIASVKGIKSMSVTPEGTYLPHQSEKKESVLINVPPEKRHSRLNFETEHAACEIKIPRGATKKEKIKAKQEAARNSQTISAQPGDAAFKNLTKKLYNEGKLPAIYFIFSKKECRHLLKFLSTESELLTSEQEQKEIESIIERYKKDGIYLGESLNIEALKKGYAIHNAGLLPSQKQLVEELFQKKLVKVVLATETLSAGINMPAKTTVISSPRKPASTPDNEKDGKRALTANEFHQMAGRAGRRGIDKEGFCLPISCNPVQTSFYNTLINSPSNKLTSSMDLDFSFIANYLSEFNDEEELKYILSKSLYTYNTGSLEDILKKFNLKKDLLIKEGFISTDGKLTDKGYMLKLINGYEQIPIINFITDKKLAGLVPKQLAGIIGGLANIEYSTKGELPEKPFESKIKTDNVFSELAETTAEELKKYNNLSQEIYPNRELKLNSKVMAHVYKWAELNAANKNSIKNWQQLYSGDLRFSIRDEGSLFKEITMTTDLIKQLTDIARTGLKLTGDRYYKDLAEKLEETLELLQREPITG